MKNLATPMTATRLINEGNCVSAMHIGDEVERHYKINGERYIMTEIQSTGKITIELS